jgi:hypothetical protein
MIHIQLTTMLDFHVESEAELQTLKKRMSLSDWAELRVVGTDPDDSELLAFGGFNPVKLERLVGGGEKLEERWR